MIVCSTKHLLFKQYRLISIQVDRYNGIIRVMMQLKQYLHSQVHIYIHAYNMPLLAPLYMQTCVYLKIR